MLGSQMLGFLGVVASFGRVLAQTAPGFPVSAADSLNVTYGTNNVNPAGELIPRGDTANPPNITTPVFPSAGKALLFLVDTDVPRNGTRVQLLHWLVSNVTLGRDNKTLSIPNAAEAAYLQPSPPVGDSPHDYTFLLFAQPSNFTVPAAYKDLLTSRVPFNISGFISAANLAGPLAANWIRVQNLTGTPTTTFPPPRSTGGASGTSTPSRSANSTPPHFTGAAVPMAMGESGFWVGLGTFAMAGALAFGL